MIKSLVSSAVYGAVLQFMPSHRCESPADEKSIVVVFLGALGDFLVFCGAAKLLVENGFTIDLVLRNGTGIEEFAKQTGLFRKVIPLNNRISHRLSNIRKLKTINCRYAFAAPLSRYALNDIYTLAVSANVYLLADMTQECSPPSVKRIAEKKADIVVSVSAVWEWDRYTEFLQGCGLLNERVTPYFPANVGREHKKIIAVFPGASVQEKIWQPESFAWVIKRLSERDSFRFFIMGNNADRSLCTELSGMITATPHEVICNMSVPETLNLLRECRMVLANDSGSAHMALYSGTPFVAVCGMWQDKRFFPNEGLPKWCSPVSCRSDTLSCINCEKSIPDCTKHRRSAECISRIEPQTVLDAAVKLLDNKW